LGWDFGPNSEAETAMQQQNRRAAAPPGADIFVPPAESAPDGINSMSKFVFMETDGISRLVVEFGAIKYLTRPSVLQLHGPAQSFRMATIRRP
jgi:hypothetical protein